MGYGHYHETYENISGQFGQIALKIYASDLKDLQATAEASKDALAGVRGVALLGATGVRPKFAEKLEANLSWISFEMEIIKVNPSTLGIAKPDWAP